MNFVAQKHRPLFIPYNLNLKENSRKMRKNPTDAERAMWSILRSGELAKLSFNRQKPLGNYIVDFYCSKAHLAIEVDGSGHAEEWQKEYDKERTAFFHEFDLYVLRFWNDEVLENPDGVYKTIFQAVMKSPLAPLFQEGN